MHLQPGAFRPAAKPWFKASSGTGWTNSILPVYDFVNPANRTAAVNAVILYGLATRAEAGSDPHENLAEIYRQAEIAWVQGKLRFGT